MKYDVIIIGAGIAGIASAIHLKKLNSKLKVLIVDKYEFPRNKLCAGYLTFKSAQLLKELDLDISAIDYQLVKGIRMIYKNKPRIQANNHGLYCQKLVDRTVLDYELFKKLQDYQIDVKEKSHLINVDEDNCWVNIDNDIYHYHNLIFADGELGYSAKYNNTKKKYFAMQMNFPSKILPKIDMYLGITKKGYAWCASSGDYINIGFCDIFNNKTNYNKIFNQFVTELGYEKELKRSEIKGFFVPFGLKERQIINDNIYLVGDAAGTVDPLTLAGISYAILSGKYVAQSIIYQQSNIYKKYLNKLKRKYLILKIMTNALYNPLVMFCGIRVGGHFFGELFSYLLDKFILNKKGSFHE